MLLRYLFFMLLTGLISPLLAQTTLSGRVVDQKGHPLPGANIMLKGTYDGATTDSTGTFRFKTARTDSAAVLVSYIGYEPVQQRMSLTGPTDKLVFRLRELANELNTVVITAGAFEASDSRRMTMLKPLDIVSTAGAGADITGVMQLLPGAQRVGEQEGLFVRGGSNLETKVVIDGMIVQNPFFSSLPDVSTRGRFQPFMFKGTSFSTGGYSAQYGQALSSVLLLNTTDKGSNNGVSLSLNIANAGVSYDYASEKSSLSATGYYSNLRPLFALVKQNVEWTRVPDNLGSSLTYRLKIGKAGMLKAYGMYSDARVGINFRDAGPRDPSAAIPNGDGFTDLNLRNRNAFITSTYTTAWNGGNWLLNTGLSYSRNTDAMTYDGSNMNRSDERTQVRAVLTRLLHGRDQGLPSSVLFGAEAHRLTLRNTVYGTQYQLNDTYLAAFAESELYLTRLLALRFGGRLEYNSVVGRANVAPRLSMAYKTGAFSQVSLAAGQFYQTPDYRYLYRNRMLDYERADHLILNYQIIKNSRTFRAELFYKNYAQLVREFTSQPGTPAQYDANPNRFPYGRTENSGKGYARGFDVFWRDQKTIKGFDYWLTYSYVDTKRLFQQYAVTATPTFVSNHNLSVITKRYVEKIRTSVNLTYAFTSGRPYYNPNRDNDSPAGFLADRTPAVHNVSFSSSYFTRIGRNIVVLYASVDNILNNKLIYTYRYAPGKDISAEQTRYAVGPTTYRSFFVGGLIMLSKKAKVNPTEF